MKRMTRLSGSMTMAAALFLAAALPAGQVSAEPISSKFDGLYKGSRQLVKPLSADYCSAPERYSVKIRNGMINGEAFPLASSTNTSHTVKGIVTSDGFFTGTEEAKKTGRTLIQGRIEGSTLVGGLLTRGDTCAWIVTLKKA